jgi:NAD(P)-dependent dehydrogenase (short-subunit alcohol dehydrogenase family)
MDSCFVSVLRTRIGSEFEKFALAQTLPGRVGQPSDIASIAVFLASEDSAWLDDPGMLP